MFKLLRLLAKLSRLSKLIEQWQRGRKVFGKISKLIAAIVGIVVSFAFMKVPFIADLGLSADQVSGQITTLIISAISVYFSPANTA